MGKRCVITGMGAVTPVGNTVEDFWEHIKNGISGVNHLQLADAEGLKVKVAAEVKDLDMEQYLDRKEIKRNDKFSIFALIAAQQAFEDSKINLDQENAARFGVMIGSGIGGLTTIQEQILKMGEKGPGRVSPLFVPMAISNMAAGNVAIKYGARGTCISMTTACATGTHSVGEAFRHIRHGYLDFCLCGGAEAPINKIGIAGFSNLSTLSLTEDPARASIPFDKDRNGFVIGEGSGVLLLEEMEHAIKRGAHIYGEVVGYGATCDAYHMTAPDPEGVGASEAMLLAMEEAGVAPQQISYINAHGTSTQLNDASETAAIKKTFGERAYEIPISSSKSMTGHLLGAAGAIEAILCAKALEEGFIPPTLGYQTPDEACDLDYVPNKGRSCDLQYVLSNSFGFGGHNGVLCLKKWEGMP